MKPYRSGTMLAVGLAILAAACQPTEQQAGEPADERAATVDTAAIEATFDSMRTAFQDAVAAGDFEAQAAIYAEDAIFGPPMEPPVRGRDAIRAVLERTTPPGATLEIRPMDFRILGPDVVYEYGTSTATFTPPGAEAEETMNATYFALFRRTESGWRLEREVLGPHAPPPAGGP